MMDLEREVRFIASNAKHNLKLLKRQAAVMDPVKLDKNIKWLEMMIKLHKADLAAAKLAKKNAQRAGRAPVSGRIKQLITSIIPQKKQVDNL